VRGKPAPSAKHELKSKKLIIPDALPALPDCLQAPQSLYLLIFIFSLLINCGNVCATSYVVMGFAQKAKIEQRIDEFISVKRGGSADSSHCAS
jgi:hypothetical protein